MDIAAKFTIALVFLAVANCASISGNELSKTKKQCANVEKHVLVLYTGGTIGMQPGPNGTLIPIPDQFEETIRSIPHMHDETYCSTDCCLCGSLPKPPICLPTAVSEEETRLLYTIIEYEQLLDSSNMNLDDWVRIARDIGLYYNDYDAFVILHGTDTMCYTAGALSYMLENLGKPVIITGAQIPLYQPRTDGRHNFINSLVMAGFHDIPEVGAFFGNELYRGNRLAKVSVDSFEAFSSPNFPPLGSMGVNIQVSDRIRRPCDGCPFNVFTGLNKNISLLQVFPMMTLETLRASLQAPTQGLVLLTYGSGNFPTNRPELLAELKAATERGVIIINVSQCRHGSVSAIYETGAALEEAGVVPGLDMTPESALAKLAYVLGRSEWSQDQKREAMKEDLRGELTEDPNMIPQNILSNLIFAS